eukprot:2084131-Pleurochrysis_carterae.AAC.1
MGKDVKPPARLHPPHLLLERGKAIEEGDEVGEQHDLQWQFSLELNAVREVADHARIRPARQGGGDVGHIEGRGGPRCKVQGHDDRASQVPHAPSRCRDEAGLATNKRLGTHTSVGRITHRD